MNVFCDTCTVNRHLDLENSKPDDRRYEEDREYLMKLLSGPVTSGTMKMFVNPSVLAQLEATRCKNPERAKALIAKAKGYHFTESSRTVFPISLSTPAQFLSQEQKAKLQRMVAKRPRLRDDEKIIADSAFHRDMDVLLTTDLELAGLEELGTVKVMLPKRLWEYYQASQA